MMAYQNDYVVSVLHQGRPVREFSENGERTVAVPFGAEYKLRLKNKSNQRCKAKVYIDGMDVNYDGGSFVLDAGQTLDLERFVEDLNSGNKFKFISVEEGKRTGEVQDPYSEDNGLIRVEFHPEKIDQWYFHTWNQGILDLNQTGSITTNSVDVSYTCDSSPISKSVGSVQSLNSTAGATTQGGNSNQSFTTVSDFNTDSPTIITLKMRGPKQREERRPFDSFQVIFKKDLIVVMANNQEIANSKKHKIKLDDSGLTVSGSGLNIKTSNYKVGTA